MMIDFSAAACAEAESIMQTYAAIDIALGERFDADVLYAVGLLINNPEAGQLVGNGCRRILLRSFPYSVIYKRDMTQRGLQVVAIAHQRRRSGYWQHRIQEVPAIYQLAA
jgi:plasmid stabilization system protein ParE